MSDRVRRIRRLLRRRLVDGALPPGPRQLLRDVVVLRSRAALTAPVARILPPRGRPAADATSVPIGARRWYVAGPIECSADDLAHVHASTAIDALERAGLHPFVVAADDGITIGLERSMRQRAQRALEPVVDAGGWYMAVRRGMRQRVVSARRGRSRRGIAAATSWQIWSLRAAGPRLALGRDQAVTVTFWEPGSHGRLERIGVRGQERFSSSSPWSEERIDGRSYPGRASLPVGDELARFDEPIDAVFTWVDGDDPRWRRSFGEWAARHGVDVGCHRGADSAVDSAVDPGRYRSRDELRFALRSIWLNAGWFRHIFIVTAGQVPSWLGEHPQVTVVPHAAIFPTDWLPVFNSHAIEARLQHVPGLAEHFVYFNDDFFVGRPLAPTAFFGGNGLPRVFRSDARVVVDAPDQPAALAVDTAAARGRQLLATRYGKRVGFKLHHAPFALRRSVLLELEQEFADEVERTARSRFRDPADLSIASAFAHHYAYVTGRAVLGRLAVEYVHLESGRLAIHLERLRRGRAFDVFCLNETEEPTSDPDAVDRAVASFLAEYFPVAAPWER